jgi:hypothetical protein
VAADPKNPDGVGPRDPGRQRTYRDRQQRLGAIDQTSDGWWKAAPKHVHPQVPALDMRYQTAEERRANHQIDLHLVGTVQRIG